MNFPLSISPKWEIARGEEKNLQPRRESYRVHSIPFVLTFSSFTFSRQERNFAVNEESPDVIPKAKEALDQSSDVPDLCSNASDSVPIENGHGTFQKSKNVQKKFLIKNSGNFKVAGNKEKYTLTKKTINATKVRTSALSNSLRESKYYKSPQTQAYNSTGMFSTRSKSFEDVIDGLPSTQPDRKLCDYGREQRDTVPKLRDADRKLRDTRQKLHEHNGTAEQLSQSLPAYGNTSKSSSQGTTARKRSEQSYLTAQRKISHNASSNSSTPKSTDSTLQPPVPTSLSRSPTPKMIFSNLINRLGGRLYGNSPSASSEDSRSSSNSSSRASTPTSIEQNVALSFRLSADEFQSCDHKLKLFFEVSLFRWGSDEEFRCLLKVRLLFFYSKWFELRISSTLRLWFR